MKKQKTRQRIRKAILLISFLVFPITIYYLSPALIIQGAVQGTITGSFFTFTLLFLFSLVFGRAWCAWVCPGGGLGECCAIIVDKPAKGGKLNWIKYSIWIPWIAVIVISFIKAGGFHKIDPFFQTSHGISIAEPSAYIIYYAVIGLFVIPAFIIGKQAFCHYICWIAPFMVIGNAIKNFVKWPSLHLLATTENCINCKLCTRNCPMSLDVNDMVQQGSMKNSECVLCGECVDTCPKKVISYSFGRPR
jgi:polyferredoxin